MRLTVVSSLSPECVEIRAQDEVVSFGKHIIPDTAA
jgi:hypothetical protein